MEDEKGSNEGISHSALSGNAPSETLDSNIGGEDDTEKCNENEGGREIMVDVVGSDVFVNGIGGDELGTAAVDLSENGVEARTENISEAMETVNEVEVNTKVPSEVASGGTRDELNDARDEGAEVSCCESISVEDDGAARGKLCALPGESVNTEVVAVDVPSSAEPLIIEQIEEVVDIAPSLNSEDKKDEVKELDKRSVILDTSGAVKYPVESIVDTQVDTSEKERNDVGHHAHMDEDSLVSQATSTAPCAQSDAPAAQCETRTVQCEAQAPGDACAGEICICNPVEEEKVLANVSLTAGVPVHITERSDMEDGCFEEAELDGGDGSGEKKEKISSETWNQTSDCQVDAGLSEPDASVDNILLAKGSLDGRETDYRERDVRVGSKIPIAGAEGGPESIVGYCGSSQKEEQGVLAQITVSHDHVVAMFESIEDKTISSDGLKLVEADDDSRDTNGFCILEGQNSKTELTGFPSSAELLETDACKGKCPSSDDYGKERSLTEIMQDKEYSPDVKEYMDRSLSLSSGTKRQAIDLLHNSSNKKAHINAGVVSTPTSETQIPKSCFKIGECIRKVANQLTGFLPSVKGNNDRNVNFPAESSSVNVMLSQLQLVAQDPKRGHKLQTSIYAFFFGFVCSIALNTRERNQNSEQATSGTCEGFEFDDVKDSYWTNRVVQHYQEEKMVHNGVTGATVRPLILPFDPAKSICKPQSRKRFSMGNYLHNAAATEADEAYKRMKQGSISSPAELILNFAERNCLPSEINLNKTFRRFGPLMESETAIDHESCHARVIFKRGSDAEVARNSAGMFKIFGPVVNYQIGYSPVISVKFSEGLLQDF